MHVPKKLTKDKEVFIRIRERFEYEVGEIIELARTHQKNATQYNWLPWFSLFRMMFPVVEAMGDLLFSEKASNKNLRLALEDMASMNKGYADLSALIILLYRNALIHQEEMRTVNALGTQIACNPGFDYGQTHLVPNDKNRNLILIPFDIPTFYRDIITSLNQNSEKDHGGKVVSKFNKWFSYDLEKEIGNRKSNDQIALEQIGGIVNGPKLLEGSKN